MELYLTGVHSEDNLWKQIEMLLHRVVKLEAKVHRLERLDRPLTSLRASEPE